MTYQVLDSTPYPTEAKRLANASAGRCHCGCPSTPSGRGGWRRCIWSQGLQFRVRRGRIEYRSLEPATVGLREWNDVKERSGLLNDLQVHALLIFLLGGHCDG